MPTEILEREDPTEATPEPEVTTAPEAETQAEVEPETSTEGEQKPEATAQEQEYEVEGQRYTAAQLKEALEAAKNKSEWQKSNTLKAQEIARQRKEVEEAIALRKILEQKPEKLQQIFAPEPERNYDAELQAHYQARPEVYDQNYINWELRRDSLIREQATAQAFKLAHTQEVQKAAQQHNESLANQAYEKYKGKVSDSEYQEMAVWLVNNVQPKNGRYPESSFDIAYKMLYGDRDIESAKLSAAQQTVKQMSKAKPASGANGTLPQPETRTPADDEDELFAKRIRERYGPAR